ncbi:hypothetical protein JST97_07565 [bacterium]|nr:hypothetical protein [bacterium]
MDDEVLVYHSKSEKATCLSKVGGLVFQACARELSSSQLEDELRSMGIVEVQEAIQETLVALGEEGLLATQETPAASFDRRRFLAAAGAAAALPVVLSTLAPRPAYALSCVNCTVLAGNVPADCTDCGKKCPAGAGCAATTTCNFEYVYDPANDGNANACQIEASGVFRCRATGGVFNTSCATSRNLVVGTAIGTRYYCCICPGAGSIFTC